MMTKLLGSLDRDDITNFMDNSLVATETWKEQMNALKAVFQRLWEAKLSARPSMCFFGVLQTDESGSQGGRRWHET